MIFKNKKFGKRFVYISVYSDEKIFSNLGLGFSPAGTKKKKDMLEVISSIGHVSVLSVTAGFRGEKRFGGYYAGNIEFGTKSINVEIMPWIKFPLLSIFINQIPIIYKLFRLRLSGTRYIVLYNTTPEVFFPALVVRTLMGFKVILQLEDGPNPNTNILRRLIESVFFGTAKKTADAIIANSTSFEASKSAVPTMIFRGNFVQYSSTINHHKVERDRFKIIMSGSLDVVRGIMLISNLLKNTTNKKMVERCEFVLFGKITDRLNKGLSDAIAIYRSRGGFAEFRGFLDRKELESEYDTADIFLSLQDPSHPFSKYSFPSKIMEYSSYRKPIVSTAVSDLIDADLFKGIVFVEHEERSLEAAILSITDRYNDFATEAEKMSRRCEAGSSLHENKIKFSRLIDRLEAL